MQKGSGSRRPRPSTETACLLPSFSLRLRLSPYPIFEPRQSPVHPLFDSRSLPLESVGRLLTYLFLGTPLQTLPRTPAARCRAERRNEGGRREDGESSSHGYPSLPRRGPSIVRTQTPTAKTGFGARSVVAGVRVCGVVCDDAGGPTEQPTRADPRARRDDEPRGMPARMRPSLNRPMPGTIAPRTATDAGSGIVPLPPCPNT